MFHPSASVATTRLTSASTNAAIGMDEAPDTTRTVSTATNRQRATRVRPAAVTRL